MSSSEPGGCRSDEDAGRRYDDTDVQETSQPPIALALVRRSDGQILTLPGLLKVDLPASYVQITDNPVRAITSRLQQLGVYAPRLRVLWQCMAGWGGAKARPVTIYDAAGWSGTPTEQCGWSTEEEICRGQRADLYRRFFGRVRERGEARDSGVLLIERPLEKPKAPACPRCGAGLRLRNRKPGEATRFDCGACRSAYEFRYNALERIPSL
jgi:ribosomal protein S27AE